MGSITFYLNEDEEKLIRKLVDRGEFPSVYAVLKMAVRRFLDGYKVKN